MEDAKDLEALVVDLIKRDNVNIPPYPVVAMRLQRLVSEEDFGMGDLQRVIGGDPVLAATILRYANSAAFRGVTHTSTLESAITRIGANEVCKIAIATSIGAHAIVTGCLSSLRRHYWRIAMTSAMLCRALAYWRKTNAEEAFICGLLHDFGQVVATACFEEIIARTRDARVLPEATWASCVERFHVELGLVTAARWNLPPMLIGVISSHHNPESDRDHRTVIDVVNACDAIAALMDDDPSPTNESLAALRVLLPGEPEYIMTVLPKIALAVAALDETTPGKDTGIFRVGSRMLTPHSMLSEPTKQASYKLQVLRSTGNADYETLYFAKDGVCFSGASKLRENSMVRLRVDAPKGPIEVLGVIVHCATEGSANRMEAKLFAAEQTTLKTWLGFYASLV
jgi:putative nucleotidyltransferase with HDIG domain